MDFINADLNYLKQNSNNWENPSHNIAYPRQTHMTTTFEKSVNDYNFDKANPNFQKHIRGTVPISLNDTYDKPKPIDRIQKRPFLCRCVTNICKSIGKGWLFPKSSYFHIDKSDLTWCVPDACGSVCVVFTWLLIFYAVFVVIFVMVLPAPSFYFRWINGLGFLFLSSMAFLSHLKSMFTNPGTISLGNATPENVQMVCSDTKKTVYKCVKCDSIKPQRAHHCSICRRCVMKMDHHCPWVNNCIGECNQKFFVLFTFYICVISVYSIYISIHFFVMCVGTEWEDCKDGFGPAASTIMIVFLLVEGILFGLFTSIMCGEQLQSIWLDETGIESLKKEQASWERKSKWLNMQLVFGHPPSWRWLCPLIEPRIQSTLSDTRVHSLHIV